MWSKASVIRGHHVSIKFWMPYIGDDLPLSCEEGNVYDEHAFAVRKADGVIVGHALWEMSRVFWFFLQHEGTGKSFVCTSTEVSHVKLPHDCYFFACTCIRCLIIHSQRNNRGGGRSHNTTPFRQQKRRGGGQIFGWGPFDGRLRDIYMYM